MDERKKHVSRAPSPSRPVRIVRTVNRDLDWVLVVLVVCLAGIVMKIFSLL